MREPPGIPEEHLHACLREQYGISPVTLEFLPVGQDSRAGVYRVTSAQGAVYLLKAKSGALYEPSCLVPRYLRDQGVASVVTPLPTTRNTLWSRLRDRAYPDWCVTVYPFIEGDTGWSPRMTDAQWEAAGAAVKQIHRVAPPPGGFPSLRKETFDPAEYGRWVRAFDAEQAHAEGGNQIERDFCTRWMENRPAIFRLVTLMEALAETLRRQAAPCVICHADLHPSNIIRRHDGQAFIIDWDDVMLAPKERDFLFVGNPPAGASTQDTIAPFFQGYGEAEIDWVALTYYRCERVVTDVIERVHAVFRRDDLGAQTKADSVRLFGDLFATGSMVDAVWSAAAHLPPNFSLSNA